MTETPGSVDPCHREDPRAVAVIARLEAALRLEREARAKAEAALALAATRMAEAVPQSLMSILEEALAERDRAREALTAPHVVTCPECFGEITVTVLEHPALAPKDTP